MASDPKDLALAKWMISKGHLDKANAQKVLKKVTALKAQGKKTSFLKVCIAAKLLEKEKAIELQKAYTARNVKKKSTASAPAAQEAEEKSAKPELETQESSSESNEDTPAAEPEEDNKDDKSEKQDSKDSGRSAVAFKKCQECMMEVPVDEKECTTCGAPIGTISLAPCGFCQTKVPEFKRTCDHCGADPQTGKPGPKTPTCPACKGHILSDDAVCPHCGIVIAQYLKAPEKVPWIMTLLMGLAFSGYGMGFYHLKQKAPPPTVTSTPEQPQAPSISAFNDISPIDPKRIKLNASPIEDQKFKAFVDGKQWPKVSEYLSDSIEPLNITTLRLWAYCLFKENNMDSIIALHKAVPNDQYIKEITIATLIKKAQELERKKFNKEAFDLLKPGIELDPKYEELLFLTAIVAMKSNYVSESREYLEKLVSLNKEEWPEAYLVLAVLYRKNNPDQFQKHLKSFEGLGEDFNLLDIYKDILDKVKP